MSNKLRESLLELPSWMYILPRFNDSYCLKISNETGITFSHVVKVCKKLQMYKYINGEKIGRIVMFNLTIEGKRVADDCERMILSVNQLKR